MKKQQLGLLIKTLQKIEVGTSIFAESCNANAHDAQKYCFYKIVCSVMQSDKHWQEQLNIKKKLKHLCVCQIYCNPNPQQNKVPLSLEFNTDPVPIQVSTNIMMNACFPLCMTAIPFFLFYGYRFLLLFSSRDSLSVR